MPEPGQAPPPTDRSPAVPVQGQGDGTAPGPPTGTAPGVDGAKPAILREATFTVRENLAYRMLRGMAIWMNKLFFSSLILLGIWLLLAYAGGVRGCTETTNVVEHNGTLMDDGQHSQCSPFLTPTAAYLGVVALATFMLSILAGLLGLMVGKQVVPATAVDDEVGARREP